LCTITGFAAASLQPNSGAQGEYTGLSVIGAYHKANGDEKRKVCLIPLSAHGTNPAVSGSILPRDFLGLIAYFDGRGQSAVMAGMRVVPVKVLHNGNLDLDDLKAKAVKHRDELAAFMVRWFLTYIRVASLVS
jgi:glycine dehydrogenase